MRTLRTSILFLGKHNSGRSQLAEAILRHESAGAVTVASAGLEPTGVNPLVYTVLEEAGIPATGQRAKSAKEFLGRASFAEAIIVCRRGDADCPKLFLGAVQVRFWEVEDPEAVYAGDPLQAFRTARDHIASMVHELVNDRLTPQLT